MCSLHHRHLLPLYHVHVIKVLISKHYLPFLCYSFDPGADQLYKERTVCSKFVTVV